AQLKRATRYDPEMHIPSEAEKEYGVGSEPLVRFAMRDGRVVALCRVVDDGAAILWDVLRVADEVGPFPYDDRRNEKHEGLGGERPNIAALVQKIEAAADSLDG